MPDFMLENCSKKANKGDYIGKQEPRLKDTTKKYQEKKV